MSDFQGKRLASTLQDAGHRLTPQRQAICDYLANTRSHPSPADVYEFVRTQYPSISLATVYNTLAVLRDLGEIVEVGPGDTAGVRYETDLTPHANLVCQSCGRIVDVPLTTPHLVSDAQAGAFDFELINVRVTGFGLCGVCRRERMK
ncbi:MAG: transcriptional repressor [Caldilineales bacterium]|nr:transcriptional repressor [Caldilineales bacterium]